MDYAIGIDLGGTNIKILVTDQKGNILEEVCCPTNDNENEPGLWAKKIKSIVGEIESKRGKEATWMGVSAPGMTSADKRTIVSMPGKCSGLEHLDWTKLLGRCELIPVLNDAHAALCGEVWKGTAVDYKNVVLLTLGTGVGGAFSLNGELQGGTLGRAGHLGHICLNPDGPLDILKTPGSVELMIGECAIKERTGGRFNCSKDLVEAHLAGDEEAGRMWLRSVYHLACALTSFINILDPEIIILGGGISKAGDALLEPLAEYMDKIEWRPQGHQVEIKLAKLGNRAGALGAIHYAMEHHDVIENLEAVVA